MADSRKQEIISEVYNDFYGSIANTFKDAKKRDPSITLADVKAFFSSNFVRKGNLRGNNSYVAKRPHQEYQLDLFFINESEDQEFSTGLLMIDIFTKFMTVVPVKTKQADDILDGIKRAFTNMGKYPEMLYTDDEGSFKSTQAERFYKEHNINHIVTRTHAPYAERAIRTIKSMIFRRLERKEDALWHDPEVLSNALVTYNYKMTHSSTRMTPEDAKKAHNQTEVRVRLEAHSVKKRKYPDVAVGDLVRIYTKKKNFKKEHVPVWSQNKYKITKIDESHGQKFYYVDGQAKPMMRHEILKV